MTAQRGEPALGQYMRPDGSIDRAAIRADTAAVNERYASGTQRGEAVELCGERIRGLFGAETTCARQKGHASGHQETDGIRRELPDPRDPVPQRGEPAQGRLRRGVR